MDFLKILKSFEEFIYEALTWLVLLPRTLLRIMLHPLAMAEYASNELQREDERRFSDAISPPLLLILCVLVAQSVGVALRTRAPDVDGSLAGMLLSSEQNLLLYRTISFGVWALAGAVYLLARMRRVIDRETLRAPFYEQCYLVSPFALLVSISVSLALVDSNAARLAAVTLLFGGALWFWLVQAAWMSRRANLPRWRGLVAATLILLAGSLLNIGVGAVLTRTGSAAAIEGSSSK